MTKEYLFNLSDYSSATWSQSASRVSFEMPHALISC